MILSVICVCTRNRRSLRTTWTIAESRRAAKLQPDCAKRLECVELAPAFEPSHALRQRQQAGRAPNASRGSSSTRTFAACEHIGVFAVQKERAFSLRFSANLCVSALNQVCPSRSYGAGWAGGSSETFPRLEEHT